MIDVEQFPSLRRTAVTLAAHLKPEQALDVMADAVIMRLDDSGAPAFVRELDKPLVGDRAHEVLSHSRFG